MIGPLRCWPGGLCLSRSIGDMDVGEFIVPVPYIKQVKAVIRRLLLSTLDDPNRKLCTAISMVVAAIAVYDWPESWPDLLPFLLKLIGDQTSMNGGVEKERGCNSTR
ncbi:importin-9-like isoform X2 [Gossypium hirsutum]|uniref:Importin-9-like isoform X2 n=1 Tax=Gossypium hirsutum TaxID=3635 RepID=A0A1U8P9T7_GOSHI|nr:importin-9-like isoform X2 [Gossypium hirsutum]